ncbi:MAG: hypothetical protein WAX44_03870 [Minisyncoccia bacterium]
MNKVILPVGNFKQKANWFLVGFVFGCIFIIVLLLSVMQKSVAKAQLLDSVSLNSEYQF